MSNTPSDTKTENLGFTIETRAGADVLVWKEGGCRPASGAEIAMWNALSAVQRPVVREPLTPERIEEICAELRNTVGCSNTTLARAIERAHGITQKGGSDADTQTKDLYDRP